MPLLPTKRLKPFEDIVGKGENAVTSIFSFSHNVVYPIKEGYRDNMATGHDNDINKDNDSAPRDQQEEEVDDIKMEQTNIQSNGIPKDDNMNAENAEHKEIEKETLIQEDSKPNVEETEEGDLGNTEVLTDADRNKMFEEALKLDKDGDKNKALRCYLKCLVGLTERSQFPLLPQCLRNISDIYHGKDEYEKAISFMQAEKLYYESMLINETELQKQLEEISKDDRGANGDVNLDLLRASEYEQLARLCSDEKQPHLALEYAGKATKLRQAVYGDDHPVVQESLNYFTALYAEAGKAQYAENLKKYEEVGPPDLSAENDPDEPPTPTSEPSSILRKRRSTDGDREKRVRFDESQMPSIEVTEREEKLARTVLLLLFFTLLIVVIILGVYIYCYLSPSAACMNFKLTVKNIIMRAKYWYYYYISGASNKYV